MKRTTPLILLIAAFSIAGCADDPLAPGLDGASADQGGTDSREAPALLRTNPLARPSSPDGEFATPLFGLATAPNGDILVADAGAGIANRFGDLEIALPGVTDVGPIGRSSHWATIGLTGDPGDDTGQGLYRVSNGHNRMIADLYDFEAAFDPDGAGIDSNPFDVASLGGGGALVADAAGNTLLRVTTAGHVDVVAVFPPELVSLVDLKDRVGCGGTPVPGLEFLCDLPDLFESQAVPTSVAVGPDGYYYVGELKGFPGATGESNVWRVAPDAAGVTCPSAPACTKVADGGFTSIIDLAFDADGILHVVEFDENGWFALENGFSAGGTVTECTLGPLSCAPLASELPIPTAITFGSGGTEWVTINALIPGLAGVTVLD